MKHQKYRLTDSDIEDLAAAAVLLNLSPRQALELLVENYASLALDCYTKEMQNYLTSLVRVEILRQKFATPLTERDPSRLMSEAHK